MKPLNSDNIIIDQETLQKAINADPLKFFDIKEKERNNDIEEKANKLKKNTAYLTSFLGFFAVLLPLTFGFFLRESDLKKIYNKIDGGDPSEISIILKNIERTTIDTKKIIQFDYKLGNAIIFKVNKIYCKDFPDQCPNAFGNYRKGK